MKKVLLTIAATGLTLSVLAQGTVQFINASTANGVNAKIFGVEPSDPMAHQTGNTATGTPTGSKVYGGAALSGTSYLAQILAADGAGKPEASLLASSSSPLGFRTGTSAGYLLPASGASVLGNVVKDSAIATLQVVAWDNSSGNYPTWAAAQTAWETGLIAAGRSAVFEVAKIGGDFNSPPYLAGLQSFNIYYIPEPSTMALLGLGAAALLIFRRRK